MTNEGNNGFTNVNEDIANTLTQNYANASSTIQMTNKEQLELIGDNACPCFGCQCEPNQVTKDAIEEARNINDTR